jgi:hypothetical protein
VANVKHLDIVRIDGCEVIDACRAEKKSENSADKIQITLAARRWIASKDKLMSIEHVKFFEFYTKFKVTLPVWERLKLLGLRKGSICDFELASDGWTQQGSNNSGSWYQFLGLRKLDGRDVNYFIYQQPGQTDNDDGLGSWETQADSELAGVDT